MKMTELSRRSGTSIASVKYYLREGLLPPGAATGRTQAEYGEGHLRRLRLIRALLDIGGLSVAAARDVFAAIDNPDLSDHHPLSYNPPHQPARRDDYQWRGARVEVLSLVDRCAWQVPHDSPGVDFVADAVAAMRALGRDDLLACAPIYAEAAAHVVGHELDVLAARNGPDQIVEALVTGTILGEALLIRLRRLALQDASARRLI
jgi:DNA-binding transcriptional MerR regulator